MVSSSRAHNPKEFHMRAFLLLLINFLQSCGISVYSHLTHGFINEHEPVINQSIHTFSSAVYLQAAKLTTSPISCENMSTPLLDLLEGWSGASNDGWEIDARSLCRVEREAGFDKLGCKQGLQGGKYTMESGLTLTAQF